MLTRLPSALRYSSARPVYPPKEAFSPRGQRIGRHGFGLFARDRVYAQYGRRRGDVEVKDMRLRALEQVGLDHAFFLVVRHFRIPVFGGAVFVARACIAVRRRLEQARKPFLKGVRHHVFRRGGVAHIAVGKPHQRVAVLPDQRFQRGVVARQEPPIQGFPALLHTLPSVL